MASGLKDPHFLSKKDALGRDIQWLSAFSS